MAAKGAVSIRDRVVGLRRVRAGDLLPNPSNWRRHPQAQRDALRGVLAEIGFADALLARETPQGLQLIDGHLRAELLPDQEVPVLVLDLDEQEALKLLATLDPLAAMAEPDQGALLALLQDVSFDSTAVNDMLAALVNGQTQPLSGLTDPDDIPEPKAECYVKRGDIWQLGEHRVMCGDSAKQDMAVLLGGQKPELLLTDPPYGIGIVKVKGGKTAGGNGQHDPKTLGFGSLGGAKAFGRVSQPDGKASGVLGSNSGNRLANLRGRVQQGGRSPQIVQPNFYPVITGDDKPFDPTYLLGLCPTIIIFGANHFASRLPDAAGWLVWDKGQSPENSFSDAELMWTNTQGHLRMYRHTWFGLVREGSRDVESLRRLHPTQKPVGLLEQIMRDFGKDGDVILDPYLGSGTTVIACERLGRVCYGMEIEPRYVQVSIERWQNYTGRKAQKVT